MKTKILLADDNQTFVSSVKLFLSMVPNVEVVGVAHDGLQAVTEAERLQPDVALLDIAMPKMNGMEAARHLKSLPRPPKIVFLSVHDTEEYRIAAASLGVDGFVDKSDFVNELFPIVTRLADGTRDADTLH
ncbi:MAG: response regulator transcription factor [Hylemonella sp.]|nr:response regulator transcription factor [Hylemonella sp.]